MSVLAKSLTALGMFEVAAGVATTLVTGDSSPAIGGVAIGCITMTAGMCQVAIDDRNQREAAISIPSQG